ncbi:MAG: response regulator [Deltaproteobacteria bacterium]|nr:response regulator [Deltaproteobacteria bacterium]
MKFLISASFFRIVAFSAGLALVPLLCVLFGVGLIRVEQSYEQTKEHTHQSMLALASMQRELNLTSRSLLNSVAMDKEIKSGSPEQIAGLLNRLYHTLGLYDGLGLYDRQGRLLASAGRGDGMPPETVDVPWEAAGTESPLNASSGAASDAASGVLSAEYNKAGLFRCAVQGEALMFAYALQGQDNTFLAAFLDFYSMRDQLHRLNLPTGYVAVFLNANLQPAYTYAPDPRFARSPDNIGESIRKELAHDTVYNLQSQENRVRNIKDSNGVKFILSFTALRRQPYDPPYLYIALAMDEEVIFNNARENLKDTTRLLVSGVVISLAALWLLCLIFFKIPAGRLLRIAKAFGQGDFSARSALPKSGSGSLAFKDFSLALSGMAEEIEGHESNIKEASASAIQAGRSKSEFLANMSHEIRTPLNAILGMTYLVQKSELGSNQRSYVNKIQGASRNLLHVINDILDFSKMEAGKMDIEQIRFAPRDLFSNLATQYKPKALESGILFEVNIAPEVPMYLVGDPLRLEQALGHLLENAFRHTWKGSIHVSCSLISIVRSECDLRITVADTGAGLGPVELESLRSAFAAKSTPSSSWDKTRQGPELGLAIAQRILEMMNGSIAVASEAGRGTIFTCTARFVYLDTDQSRHSVVLTGKRVLIADSDEISLALYGSMLNNFSLYAKGENRARAALEELAAADARGEPYDFFMLDWRNLELDSSEIINQVRNGLSLGRVPRILVIAEAGSSEVRKKAEEVGADVFLHKPMDASVLLDIMMGLYNGSELSQLGKAVSESLSRLPTRTLSGLRVLLVEDNLLNQQLAQEIMEQQEIEVSLAVTGSQALRSIAAGQQASGHLPFDLVLMDLQMPEMDGFEATWRIRKDSHLGAVYLPIIAMTAHSSPEEINACYKAGMDDYASKPIDITLFFEALGRWLPILPDNDRILGEDFCRLLKFTRNQDAEAMSVFALMQEPLKAFIGEGRVKKLQKMIWEHAWPEAAAFCAYLADLLFPGTSLENNFRKPEPKNDAGAEAKKPGGKAEPEKDDPESREKDAESGAGGQI